MDRSKPPGRACEFAARVAVFLLLAVAAGSVAAEARPRSSPAAKESKAPADPPGSVARALASSRAESGDVPDAAAIRNALEKEAKGKPADALAALEAVARGASSSDARALARLAAGGVASRSGRSDAAVDLYRAAAESPGLASYARFLEGAELFSLGKAADARKAFEASLKGGDLPPRTELEANVRLGQIAVSEKNRGRAREILSRVAKKARGTELEAEALLAFYRSDRKAAGACKQARELFTKFPTLPDLGAWGPDLRRNQLDGVATGCEATPKDVQARMRRLQWGGEPDRAQRELQSLRATEGDSLSKGEYATDAMLANHLVNEGRVEEALQLLLAHYEAQRGRSGYQLLLAKAAARAGEYASAIGAYDRAYKMKPKGADGRNALFQAAFMSYQAQDYDGALSRFEAFLDQFPTSNLARDSRWYLAWIRYLRGDFDSARSGFEALEKLKPETKKKRRRRSKRGQPAAAASDSIGRDRLAYWKAMCLLRSGRAAQAAAELSVLARDPGYGYYGVLAHYRLRTLAPQDGLGKPQLTEAEIKALAEAERQRAEADEADASAEDGETGPGDDGVEDSVADASEESGDATAAANEASGTQLAPAKKSESGAAPGSVEASAPAAIARRFALARKLSLAGFPEHARRELAEIEARARSGADKRALLQEYRSLGNFHRSSYLAETAFGGQRLRGGLQGERALWEAAYPRAFASEVAAAAKESEVPEELVWSIMRAESHYRPEAYSPVGAIGLMQMMPFTGRKVAELMGAAGPDKPFEPRSLFRPEANVRLGARYLRRLSDAFQGSVPLVAAGYNAGPHRVRSWLASFGALDMDEFIEHVPFVETRNYVKRVVRNYQLYEMVYGAANGSEPKRTLTWLASPISARRDASHSSREAW